MKQRPHRAARACNAGSSRTWPCMTKTGIGLRVCEKGILLPVWNAGNDGRWQCKTRTNIGQAILRERNPWHWSVGSDSRWPLKTRTNIVQRSCDRSCSCESFRPCPVWHDSWLHLENWLRDGDSMLKRDAKLVEKEHQKVSRQRKAQQKKDQEERKRAEVLKQKRQREEERSRREWVRKRMRSDLTMDDILGQHNVRNHQ